MPFSLLRLGQTTIALAIVGALVATHGVESTITQSFYASPNCSGSPTGTYTHTAGACTLGGLVYSCAQNKQCLEIRILDGGNCSGDTLISSEAYACDECTGGSDTTVSTTVTGCNTAHPEIMSCIGSGTCAAGSCQNDSGNLTVGCIPNIYGSSSVDVRVVPCSAVILEDYQGYQSCTGSVLSRTVFPAGICEGGMIWQC